MFKFGRKYRKPMSFIEMMEFQTTLISRALMIPARYFDTNNPDPRL